MQLLKDQEEFINIFRKMNCFLSSLLLEHSQLPDTNISTWLSSVDIKTLNKYLIDSEDLWENDDYAEKQRADLVLCTTLLNNLNHYKDDSHQGVPEDEFPKRINLLLIYIKLMHKDKILRDFTNGNFKYPLYIYTQKHNKAWDICDWQIQFNNDKYILKNLKNNKTSIQLKEKIKKE